MLKKVQIENLEKRVRELEGETQRLMIENEVLNDRIDKAIKFIKKTRLIKGTEFYRIQLLNILKGEE